jgi:predicted outer membrane repeat protein
VILSNSAATFGGALAAKKAGLPHIWSIHEVIGGGRPFLHYLFGRRALARFILDHSARVIVNSEQTRSAFPVSEKLVLIYNGLSVRPGDPARRSAARIEFGLSTGTPAVGVIGKFYPGKGQKEVLQAVARLGDRYPGLKLLLIGEIAEARYERELRSIVRREGLDGRIHFTGYRSDLLELLQTLSVVVVASIVDSFGRAALEAMAAGVPVLAVRAGGLSEVVQSGWNGFLADSRDPEVLAAALADVFDHPERLPEIIENGFRTIRDKFSIERQVNDVERVLTEIGGGPLLVPPPFGAGRDGAFFAENRGRGREDRKA